MARWEDEISGIIARKERRELEQAKARLKEAGRFAPCRHFTSFPPTCHRWHELHCLTCPDYAPQETPGELGKGYATFESGNVIHLVEHVRSDGYYRSGRALCGRLLSEEKMAVEIYPLESFAELDELKNEEAHAEGSICRTCRRRYRPESTAHMD